MGTTPVATIHIRVASVVAAALGVTVLGGCTTSETCVDWVAFDDEEARIAESALVADVDLLERDGTQSMYGADANVWSGEVTEVVQAQVGSTVAVGDEIRIVSTPETCTDGSPYPSGDPLDTDRVVRVYLHEDGNGSWSLITPYDGVGPLDG